MKFKLVAIILLASSLLAAAPQPQSDTPAGHQFAAWLEAFYTQATALSCSSFSRRTIPRTSLRSTGNWDSAA